MNEYVYLQLDGTWHRAVLEAEVVTAPGQSHRPITVNEQCGIRDGKPDASSFTEPPADEPRHEACWA